MNWAHIHLMFNHVPLIGTAFCLFLLVVGLFHRSGDLQKVALWGLIGTALVTLVVFYTGDPAEDMLKGVPGVTLRNVHDHEEMAEKAFIAIELLGAMALVVAIVYRRAPVLPRWALMTMLAGSVAVVVMMGITANLGGHIHHPEIGAPAADDDDDGRVYRRDGGR